MKTYDDVKVGDTVYIWGKCDTSIKETTVVNKEEDDDSYWNLEYENGCEGYTCKNDTSASMGMYGCSVYSCKEAVKEAISEHIEHLKEIII